MRKVEIKLSGFESSPLTRISDWIGGIFCADSVVDAWVVRVGAQVNFKVTLGTSHSWLALGTCRASEVACAITCVDI